MRILNAEVVDPRLSGLIERPYILVNVEELGSPTSEASTISTIIRSEWTTQRYGAFTEVRVTGEAFSIGRFNNLFAGKYDPMVQVEVFDMADEYDVPGHWLLPLRRARQMLRKFAPDWRLLMNDRDGQDGLVSWTPVRTRGQRCCREGRPCYNDAVGSVLVQRVEIPMCPDHIEQYNRRQAQARTQVKS